MTTYNYGILSMQKTYNSRLECPQGRDLKTCRVEICDRCTIHLAASSVSSASPTPPQVSEYDYLRSIIHHITSACQSSTYPRIICIISISTPLSALHSRFHTDLPYTRIGASNLVVVNQPAAQIIVALRTWDKGCWSDQRPHSPPWFIRKCQNSHQPKHLPTQPLLGTSFQWPRPYQLCKNTRICTWEVSS